jgi:hypothetical protein
MDMKNTNLRSSINNDELLGTKWEDERKRKEKNKEG